MGDEQPDTHRVVREHRRRREVFEEGDTITPTEGELDAFGDKFEPLDEYPDDVDEDDVQEVEDEGDEEVEGEDEVEQEASEDEGGEDSGVPFDEDDLDDADYDELRSYASEVEDVNGNWGEERLRAELKAKVE